MLRGTSQSSEHQSTFRTPADLFVRASLPAPKGALEPSGWNLANLVVVGPRWESSWQQPWVSVLSCRECSLRVVAVGLDTMLEFVCRISRGLSVRTTKRIRRFRRVLMQTRTPNRRLKLWVEGAPVSIFHALASRRPYTMVIDPSYCLR